MKIKKLLLHILLFAPFGIFAQEFTFSPEKPQAGEEISIHYKPSAMIPAKITAKEFIGLSPQEIDFKATRSRGEYSATFKTNSNANFVYFGIVIGENHDNNKGDGYWIKLYDGDKPKENANMALSYYFQYYGEEVGVSNDTEKAMTAMAEEAALYPNNRSAQISYLRMFMGKDAEAAKILTQEKIDATLDSALLLEEDYDYLGQLYSLTGNKDRVAEITQQKKDKFPEGKWVAAENLQEFYGLKDVNEQKAKLDDILKNIKTKDNWKHLAGNVDMYKSTLLRNYINSEDWEGFDSGVRELEIENSRQLNSLYNSAAWKIYETNNHLELGESYAKKATDYAKKEWNKAVAEEQARQKIKNAESLYASYADTYANVLFSLEKYKDAFDLAKTASMDIKKGEEYDYNETYAKIAEKVLPQEKFKAEIEQFVINGKATSVVKDLLKEVYIKENGKEEGFAPYLADLEVESKRKMRETLLQKLENKPAPTFSLLNLDGTEVSLENLKGKVVVVDFWATWCGPCIASFPAMTKAQENHSNDPNVKFVFINSWERSDDIKKQVTDFISNGNYPFDVLFDTGDKVITSYGVSGIPTKFIIGKNGNIRFTSIGFGGNTDRAVDELSMMIEIAGEE